MDGIVILDNLVNELMESTMKIIKVSGKLNDVAKSYLAGLREGIIQGILYSKGFPQNQISSKRVIIDGNPGWLFTKTVETSDINKIPLSATSEIKKD